MLRGWNGPQMSSSPNPLAIGRDTSYQNRLLNALSNLVLNMCSRPSNLYRKILHCLYIDLLGAKQVLGFFNLSVFHLSAAFVFPLSSSHALCPRQVSEIKD